MTHVWVAEVKIYWISMLLLCKQYVHNNVLKEIEADHHSNLSFVRRQKGTIKIENTKQRIILFQVHFEFLVERHKYFGTEEN